MENKVNYKNLYLAFGVRTITVGTRHGDGLLLYLQIQWEILLIIQQLQSWRGCKILRLRQI
jgi:hypothetical protein